MAPAKTERKYQGTVGVGKSRGCRPLLQKSAHLAPAKVAQEPISEAVIFNVREILSVASTVAAMPDREAIQRYHDLVDKKLVSSLTPADRFELERIEARLDASERDTEIDARNREMEAERTRILDSIQTLLAGLKR